jgi:hypothetical protein
MGRFVRYHPVTVTSNHQVDYLKLLIQRRKIARVL